ncbi:aldo/keto reductase [Pseudonocardia cypriaca]|uniref:aldo/keto reductase n=1 Tax=Pseudonocardia cypriaca TaxID=882449 RepID=UPI001B868E3B|nr:aldo/keto reductase [Pseudonocardia cypriaca]
MTAALPRRGRIVLGAMNFGTTVADDTAFALLDAYVDAGGAWIDTANCYAFWNDPSGVGGQSEELIGRWLAARPGVRDRVRIATKVRQQPLVPHRWPESAEGLSAAAIADAVPASLRRLGVDHVDLLWAHAEDRTVPLEETVAAFGEVVAQGVARRLGASNHAAWRVERARGIARDQGVEGWSALQLRRSYVEPRPGAPLPDAGHRLMSPDDLDYAAAEDLEVWAYTPLLNGGYVRADRPFPQAYDTPAPRGDWRRWTPSRTSSAPRATSGAGLAPGRPAGDLPHRRGERRRPAGGGDGRRGDRPDRRASGAARCGNLMPWPSPPTSPRSTRPRPPGAPGCPSTRCATTSGRG